MRLILKQGSIGLLRVALHLGQVVFIRPRKGGVMPPHCRWVASDVVRVMLAPWIYSLLCRSMLGKPIHHLPRPIQTPWRILWQRMCGLQKFLTTFH